MEYFGIAEIVSFFGGSYVITLSVAGGIFLALHILQGLGLVVMARRAGIRGGTVMAFVPFVNDYLIGRLAGDCTIFGKKFRHCGIFYAAADVVCAAASAVLLSTQILLSPYLQAIGYYMYDYVDVPETLSWADTLNTVMEYAQLILNLVYIFLLIVVLFSFFRKYAARYSLLFAVCSAVVPVKGAFIFAVRHNVPVDYEAYIRARREEYYRRQRQYYDRQNPGSPPYGGGPYDLPPYGGPYDNGRTNAPPPDDDPFREFSQQDSDAQKNEKPEDRSENDEFFGKQ